MSDENSLGSFVHLLGVKQHWPRGEAVLHSFLQCAFKSCRGSRLCPRAFALAGMTLSRQMGTPVLFHLSGFSVYHHLLREATLANAGLGPLSLCHATLSPS